MTTLITVRPGPVLHVWRNGSAVCEVNLTMRAALSVCRDILEAMQFPAGENTLPNEGLPFVVYQSRGEAEKSAAQREDGSRLGEGSRNTKRASGGVPMGGCE